MLNFGNEPGLKSEISACGPSVRSRRRGPAFLGTTRGLRAAQVKPSPTRLSPWPPRFPGPLGHPPGHPRCWLRFGTFFLLGYLRLKLADWPKVRKQWFSTLRGDPGKYWAGKVRFRSPKWTLWMALDQTGY